MARRPYLAGNWKMFKTHREAAEFIKALAPALLADGLCVDVALAPPFTALASAVEAAHSLPLTIASQNLYWENEGAFTGEISAPMLTALGVKAAIIGHSERRQYFGETDEGVNRKIRAALAAGLVPIMCLGETLTEREAGQTEAVLERQLAGGLAGIPPQTLSPLILAYEPVWAIGTGRTASPDQAQAVHAFIRAWVSRSVEKDLAFSVRLLYGGSVKPENAKALLSQPDIDGALVGGASLDPQAFTKILQAI